MNKKTRIPEDFKVSARVVELAAENGWPNPHLELPGFIDYHLAHGSLMADWEAAFRTWLRNASQWRGAGKLVNQQRGGFVPSPPKTRPPMEKRKPLTEEEKQRNIGKLNDLVQELAAKKAMA